jgi:adenosylcobinamide-GDP ribazoletransferase
MPQLEWKKEDMEYMLCFFPLVGAVIGISLALWRWVCQRFLVGELSTVLIGAAIPLALTGGFHIDGFLDTMDALHSYQPREKKLEILKDTHIGAFAVIMLSLYGLVYLGASFEIKEKPLINLMCSSFFFSRCLSGLSMVSFSTAKKEGMLYHFSDSAKKSTVRACLFLQGLACIVFMLWQSLVAGGILAAVGLFCLVYYYVRTKKEFGGITGDTAGYFVLLCEESMLVALAIIEHLSW